MKKLSYGIVSMSEKRHLLTITSVGNANRHYTIAEFKTLHQAEFVAEVLNKYGSEERTSQLLRQMVSNVKEAKAGRGARAA